MTMSRQDIIDMAVQAGFKVGKDAGGEYVAPQYNDSVGTLMRFADLVAGQEREACAKACDALSDLYEDEGSNPRACASAIRARGDGK